MTTSGIYIIRNLVSGKAYVGSAVDIKERWWGHLSLLKRGSHGNIHLQRSWNKHEPEAFEFKAILYCEPVILIHYEQFMIDKYKEVMGWDMLYNMSPTAGSSLGIKRGPLSSEHREKLRVASTGRKHPPEILAKMSAAQKGRKFTPEARAKISATLKGRKLSPELIAKMKGRKASPETRAKMSASNKGRKHTVEARAKISATHMGMKPSPETRAKMSAVRMGKIPWNKGKKGLQTAWNKGKGTSLEHRAKLSAACKGGIPWNKGKKPSPETRAKMSAGQRKAWKDRKVS